MLALVDYFPQTCSSAACLTRHYHVRITTDQLARFNQQKSMTCLINWIPMIEFDDIPHKLDSIENLRWFEKYLTLP